MYGTTVIIVGIFVALVTSSMRSNTLLAVPVSQLRAQDAVYIGQRLRVAGFVDGQPATMTTVQTADGMVSMHHFVVVDGKARVAVDYRDVLPDTFRPGGPVQVDGVYSSAGVMEADHVLTKCPSKYQSEQVYRQHQAAAKSGASSYPAAGQS